MDETSKQRMRAELDEVVKGGTGSKVARFVIAALSGVIPVFGGAVGGAAGAWSEKEQSELNRLLNAWLKRK